MENLKIGYLDTVTIPTEYLSVRMRNSKYRKGGESPNWAVSFNIYTPMRSFACYSRG